MEWVETTGRTVEDAKEAALDQLGIDETEAEFEVLEEPKTGLFGRPKGDARIRARVVPRAPRPKQERRPRRQRSKSDGAGRSQDGPSKGAGSKGGGRNSGPRDRRRDEAGSGAPAGGQSAKSQEGKQMTEEDVPVSDQADIITEFLEGLLASLDAEGTVSRTEVDEETIELSVDGPDLGLLIGPKGQTLTAVHELSRTVLQRRATGRHVGRVRIDIGGYRQRRQEALARFARAQAAAVLEEGTSRALEPMNAADRKVVHDTINEIEGVATISEGADPQRRVVIVPEGAAE